MLVLEPSPVKEKKSKEYSTSSVKKMKKKKKRNRESEKGKYKPESNSEEYLEMDMAGAMSGKEDQEAARRLAKKRKVGKGKLEGDDKIHGNFSSIIEKKACDMNVAVDVELDQKNGKKKMKKDAVELEEQGDQGFVTGEENGESKDKTMSDKKNRKKKNKKANKDARELEERDNVDMGQGDHRVGQDTLSAGDVNSGTKERRKGKDKNETGKMDKEKMVQRKDKDKRASFTDAVDTLSAGDMNCGTKERRKGKNENETGKMVTEKMARRKDKDKRVSFTDAVDILSVGDVNSGTKERRKGKDKNETGKMDTEKMARRKDKDKRVSFTDAVDTLSAGNVNIGTKERRKGKYKNDTGKMDKKKMVQRKDKDKRVSFTDAVEILGGGVDDERVEGSESQLVHGKRFTKEEDAKILEAIMDYAKIKQFGEGEKGLEMFRTSLQRRHPEIKGCWGEIAKVLPHRPPQAVYWRARILLYRSTARKWTEEEYEIIRSHVKENGNKWVKLAALLGKSNIHVKDTWRRIKLETYRKGPWTQDEYQNLFDLVNLDLRVKANTKSDHGHRNIRDNISWEAISDKLTTRSVKDCCLKWYQQLASPLVKEGAWANTDDYLLVEALGKVDAVCLEDVDWDNLLDHRSGEHCRQRWNQMVRLLGDHREKPFIEQVEVLSRRYSLEMLEYRK